MPSPIVPQGALNRLRGSVTFDNLPQLNITAPFLGEEGINLTLEGEINTNVGTMTGTVQSPAPYQMALVEVQLLKTQTFADLFKQQLELDSNVGSFTVRPDAPQLSPYIIFNGNIVSAAPGRLNGKEVGFVIGLRGFYLVNSSLYNGI